MRHTPHYHTAPNQSQQIRQVRYNAPMPDKQRTLGQFETPPDVADLLLGLCLRHPAGRVLDPSCGTGAFLARVARWQQGMGSLAGNPAGDLWGVELDATAAQQAAGQLPQAIILNHNFFALQPGQVAGAPFDAILGNPPYTRAGWLDRMEAQLGQQLPLFDPASPDERVTAARPGKRAQAILPGRMWGRVLNRRAGLHAYFFVHSAAFLREGGRLGFVVPNGWLDVAYGEALKQFLLDDFKVVALIESQVERWFPAAKVNTCLVVLERCQDPAGRAHNLVRFIRLRRPLRQLIPPGRERYSAIEQLAIRLLPAARRDSDDMHIQVVPQAELRAADKWGVTLRAPAGYRRQHARPGLVPLHTWASVQRGYTSGANHFFYLTPAIIAQWGIEPQFRRPLLKSLRGQPRLQLRPADCTHEVLLIPPTARLEGTAAAEYVAWGEAQGLGQVVTCAARRPWYALPPQTPPPLVLPKGVWRWHMAPRLLGEILVDQQLYAVYPAGGIEPQVAAALLNSSWLALQLELHGRVNFGAGVLWLATYELENVRLPNPRQIPAGLAARLAGCFAALAAEPAPARTADVAALTPGREALDEAVSDLLGLAPAERLAVRQALAERLAVRRQRAQLPPPHTR